ncbi:MAG: hypothetical protein QME12_07750 [Nanoarchaeota archaeon]|nr:hypothetical protein [Nanoarchaeota archaeon]
MQTRNQLDDGKQKPLMATLEILMENIGFSLFFPTGLMAFTILAGNLAAFGIIGSAYIESREEQVILWMKRMNLAKEEKYRNKKLSQYQEEKEKAYKQPLFLYARR